MKKLVNLLLLVFVFAIIANGQVENEYKYYHYKGKINNKYPITMDIFFTPENVSGSYYYDKIGKRIRLYGDVDKNGFFELTESNSDYNTTGYFEGKLNDDNSISGKWLNKDKTKSMPFFAKENYVNSAGIKYYNYNTISYVEPNDEDSYYCEIKLNYAYPVTTPIRSACKPIQKDYLDYNSGKIKYYTNSELDYTGKFNNIEDFINKYAKIIDTHFECSKYENNYDYNYFTSFYDEIEVWYNDKNILVLESNIFEYTGGAHGLGSTDFLIYDLENGKYLGYDDIFLEGKEEAIYELLEKKVNEKSENDDNFYVSELYITENIALDGNSIYFSYDPYEIAPYSVGYIKLAITYKELSQYLTPKFKAKMNIK